MRLKILNSLFLIAFVSSALVQVNDPDPLYWIVVYSMAALICLLHSFKRLPVLAPVLLILLTTVWILLLLPSLFNGFPWSDIFASLTMRSDAVEEAREIGGLILVLFWSLVLYFVNIGELKSKKKQ